MKRIIYFLMVLLFVAGCSKYEYQLSDPGLTVKESHLDFTAKGGEGYILVESNTPIEAKSDSGWCRVKVDGKRINVSVTAYTGIEYRTAIIAVTAGNGFPVNVPVTQTASQFIIGNLFSEIDFRETALRIEVISDKDVTVTTTNDWIETRYEKDSVFIIAYRNESPDARTGTIEVTSNNITQTITIKQKGRPFTYEDVLGDWEMSYQTSSTSDVVKNTVRFVKSKADGYYDVTGLKYGVLKVKYNSTNRTLEIFGGQDMGKFSDPQYPQYKDWTVVAMILNKNDKISWSDTYYYQGVWNNRFDSGMGFAFKDSGTWTDEQITGLVIVISNKFPITEEKDFLFTGITYSNISLKKL